MCGDSPTMFFSITFILKLPPPTLFELSRRDPAADALECRLFNLPANFCNMHV
jgi:hypothetical protein